MRMGEADDIRSLDARVARLTKAVAKTCDAQLQSVETVNRMTIDIASLMADVRELGRRYEHMAVAVHRLTGLLDGREEMKSTSAYPVASGAYDDDLARMASAGSGYRQMADHIGCDESVVARRCRLIGIESPLARKKWTRREDDVLRQAARTATTWEEVASELPLRSEGACKSRAKYLGVSLYKRSRIWSDEDDDFMREHWTACDMDVHAIAHQLGRTEEAVRSRARLLGLADGTRRSWTARRENERFWNACKALAGVSE